MAEKNKYIIIFLILVIALGSIGFFGWRIFSEKNSVSQQPAASQQKVNYLIPGVPYYGFYNQFFAILNSSRITSVAEILGYWGDEVNLPVLRNTLIDKNDDTPGNNKKFITNKQLEKFFQEKGYETHYWSSSKPGGEIDEIKKFVNVDKKIPVIIFQNRSLEPGALKIAGFRVVIGVSDERQKVTVQDYNFGNNYEISYQDFEAMFDQRARVILAVWPKSDLLSKLPPRSQGISYPARIKAMDNVGELLIKRADSVRFFNVVQYEKSLELYQGFLADPKFSYFPPAYQVFFYDFLAKLYLKLDKPDEALKVINEKALPLNHDLKQPFGDWKSPTNVDQLWGPYYVLGNIYQKKGDKELAIKNYEEVLKMDPGQKPALKFALEALRKVK